MYLSRVLQKVIQVFGDDQRKQCKAAVLQMMTEVKNSYLNSFNIKHEVGEYALELR